MNFSRRILNLFSNSKVQSRVAAKKRGLEKTRRSLFMEGLENRRVLDFTAGNLVVLQVGDGAAALSSTSNQVTLREFTPAGVAGTSVAIPTTGAGKLTISGSATSEGQITLSQDGAYLIGVGYDANAGTTSVVGTSTATVARLVSRIGVNEAVDVSTSTTDYSENNIRSAASVDGSRFWIAGPNTVSPNSRSLRTTTFGASGAAAEIDAGGAGNYRVAQVFNNQLYVSTSTSIRRTDTPLPTGNSTLTPLALTGVSLTNIYDFVLLDRDATANGGGGTGYDTLYVADQTAGITKFSSTDGVNWAFQSTLAAVKGVGVEAKINGASVNIFGTNGTSAGNTFVTFTDTTNYDAPMGTPTATVLATAATNRAFRGVAFAPSGAAAPAEVNVTGLSNNTITDGDSTPALTDGTQFVDTTVNSTSTRTFTIHNTGGTALTISGSTVTPINGSGAAFIVQNLPSSIAAGGSANFSVEFTPTSATLFEATISFTNSDADEATYNFDVKGTGTAVIVNQPPTITASGPFGVAENSTSGAAVGTVTATDPENNALTFTSLGTGTGASLFDISTSGAITVHSGAVLDFEGTNSYTYNVRVTDNGSPNEFANATVTINLTNVNEAPFFAVGAINRSVVQNSANGTVITGGAVSATDPDLGGTVASYQIVSGNGTGAGAFAISTAGIITVADAAQVATVGSYSLQVTATDNQGLVSASKLVTVSVNANSPPVFNPDVFNFSVIENSANNTNVGTPLTAATDANGDAITYSISATGNGTGAGAFKINASRQIQINDTAQVNFEAAASFTLTVIATDIYGATDTATVNITVTNSPDGPYIPPAQAFTIAENSSNATVVGTVSATFDPETNPADRRFEFTAGNTGGAFAISNTGVITVANSAAVDYEAFVNHLVNLTVRAFVANTTFTFSQTVGVNLTNVHEGTILVPGDILITAIVGDTNDEFTFAPTRNLAAGTEVRFTDYGWLGAGGFRASGEGVIVYVAPAGGLAAGTEIGITKNGTTNAVTLSRGTGIVFDETGTTNFAISTSGDSLIAFQGTVASPTPLYAVTTYRDTFDADSIDSNTTALPTGLTLGSTAVAVGGASADNDNAEYSGIQISPVSTIKSAVGDSANWTKSGTRFNLTYADFIFDSPPTDIGLSANTIPENSVVGTPVGLLSTTDADAGDTFTYTLVIGTGSDDNASFAIVGNELRTNAAVNFEMKNNYTVRVRSADAAGLFVEEAFTISVSDQNESPTAISLSDSSIAEEQPIGSTVATLSTTDDDLGETFTYTLVTGAGSTDNASFTIDGNVLKSAELFDFQTKNSYSIRVRSTDSDNLSTEQEFTISISDVRLTLSNAVTAKYKENGLPLLISNAAAVLDVQLLDFDGGLVTAWFSGNGTADDRLSVKTIGVNLNQIRVDGSDIYYRKNVSNVPTDVLIGTFAGGNGANPLVITFNASAFKTEVQAALRAITFANVSDDPSTAPREVSFAVADGDGGTSNTVIRTVEITAVNDRPVVTTSQPLNIQYTENGTPVVIDGGVTISDVDSDDFGGGVLTVKIATGRQATDLLGIESSGHISVNTLTSEVSFDTDVIGTYAGTSLFTVTLNAMATPERVRELARHITFSSLSEGPTTTPRGISFTVSDGDLGTSLASALDSVSIVPVNDAPVLNGFALALPAKYTENGVPSLIANVGSVVDVDVLNFDGGTLTASLTNNGTAEDRLSIKNVGTGANQISLSGNTIIFTKLVGGVGGTLVPTPIGTFTGGVGSNDPLVITFNADAFRVQVQAALKAITFATVTDAPSTAQRTVSFVLTDGDSGMSDTVSRLVDVVAVNDRPVVGNIGGAANWTIGSPNAQLIYGATTTVVDPDSSNFNGGKLTISISGNRQSGDLLEIQGNGGGITLNGSEISFNGNVIGTYTGTYTLTINFTTNDATAAATEALIKRISFRSPSLSTSTRTVSLTLTDGDLGTSLAVTQQVNAA